MSWIQSQTPEKRKEIIAKGLATKRKNRLAREEQKLLDIEKADVLKQKIKQLEANRDSLEKHHLMDKVSLKLTNKILLREEEIVSGSILWSQTTGVYFLIDSGKVIYVGQSVNVYGRISEHWDKTFDSFAYIPCEKESLNALESLYIHLLRPPMNGNSHGGKTAPISLNKLLEEMI
jgi:hypothetical protein